MKPAEWDILSRRERENVLSEVGVTKSLIVENAKANFGYLDEEVKAAVSGGEFELREEYPPEIKKMIQHFNAAKDAVDKKDFWSMFAEYNAAMEVHDGVRKPLKETAKEIANSYMDALYEKLRARCR